MDGKTLLRRYLEQRRELGESELVLDSLHVEDVMRLIGATGTAESEPAPQRRPSIRESVPAEPQDWRSSLRDAGVNVDAREAATAPVVELATEFAASSAAADPSPKISDDMAFKKGMVVGSDEAEL